MLPLAALPGSPAGQPAVWMWLILQTAHISCPVVAAVEQNSAVVIMTVAMLMKDLSCGDMCLMDLCCQWLCFSHTGGALEGAGRALPRAADIC